MESLKLSTIAIVLGLAFAGSNFFGIIRPARFGETLRKFPRHGFWGYPLMMLATVWFLYYLREENVADFASFKPVLYAAFALVGVSACIFLRDFLPVRGLAVLLLLAAKAVLDAGRWVETDWRWVLSVWAYVWVFAGMCLTVSPWWFRDFITWFTASISRIRAFSVLHVTFGVFVAVLGFTAIRSAENNRTAGVDGLREQQRLQTVQSHLVEQASVSL